jgi:hypothetical protein
MDTYRPVGRDVAIQHLAASMSLKREPDGSGFSQVLAPDAAEALQACEAQGFE